jgi:tetratricopeptide (TPR) repeat protein/opacity protein-like surface antigen
MRSGTYALLASRILPAGARCAGWALVLTMLVPGAGEAQERCEPPAARVVSLQGAVELRLAGTDAWTPATLGEALCLGDALRVGRASRAALALANDATLRLDERTTLQLRGVAEEARSLIDLILGGVYFFSHRPRALEVDTPFVNAAAEGTEFLVRVGADRAEVVMLDGRVLLRNPEGELRVASGDAALVAEGEAPRAVVVARPRDAVAWALYYPPILTELAGRGVRARPLPPGLQSAVERVAANDYAGALDALEAVPEAARDARYDTYRAGVLLNVGRVEEAEAAIEQALARDPDAGEALAQRAVIHVVQNREAEALADARRALELSPDSAAAAIALSYALQAAFQLEEARAVLRAAVEQNPEDALAWARLAELEQMFGDLRASRNAAEQAVALAPDLARTQMVLGFAALTRIDIDGARAAFERAIALDSANPLPRLGLGLAVIRSGDLEGGRKEIEIAASLDPNDSLIRSYLGKAYFEEKRNDLANEQFAIAQELDPLDPTAYLYEAIKQQTENRPGEALQKLQKSIELNDNRAVFRSRLLLDADRAARGTSLARIYDDLGFLQPGINEATKSLALDPASAAAHRFLSDIYVGARRREIARVSTLLQAQMLQDLNINPVQPSLSEANLNIVTQGGPARAGFNEFTPLFERNQAQLNAAGVVGSDNTYGGEGVASMVYDRYSVSGGAFGYRTDGWRQNNDNNQDVQDVYFQSAITPELNAQVEYRRRHSDQGDLALNFDPAFFSPNLNREIDQNTYRVGVRYSPLPSSDFLLSFIYGDLEDHIRDSLDVFSAEARTKDQGTQTEAQYIYRRDRFNSIIGIGYSDVDRNLDLSQEEQGFPPSVLSNEQQITEASGYLYSNMNFPDSVTWTAGVSYDLFEHNALKVEKVNPKFGVQWHITKDFLLRGAALRFVKPALINNQTLEPTEVAGFNQLFDDTNGAAAWRYGVGLDYRLMGNLFVGGEATWREISNPILDPDARGSTVEDSDEQTHHAYVHWLPIPQVALSAEFVYDRFSAETGKDLTQNLGVFPEKVETYSVPFGVRYFHPSGFFAGVGATYVNQQVNRADSLEAPEGSGDFFVVDAGIGYRLPKRFGVVSLAVLNMFDNKFKYQDDSFREFQTVQQPSIGPYIPDRQILARVTLNW